jgi:hypothetical protein
MKRRSFHSSILDDIQLDITKSISHVRTTLSDMKQDIQEVIDNGKGYCIISIDSTLLGYITSNKTQHAHTNSIKPIEEEIAKSLLKFNNNLVTEEKLKDFIYNESPICDKDDRTINRIFKGIRREMKTETITLDTGEDELYYWPNSYISKYTDIETLTWPEYMKQLLSMPEKEQKWYREILIKK